MKKGFLYCLLCSLCILFGCNAKETVNEYHLVPQPNQIAPQKGCFALTGKVKIVTASISPEVKVIAGDFIARLQQTAGITLEQTEKATSNVPSKVCPKKAINCPLLLRK